MPGGRLTQEDRWLISAGIAEGAGYAEIARRLDRPTSTVSREIARNGGPGGYRAEHAHQATGYRARRRKLTSGPGPSAEVDSHSREVRDFAERFARTMVDNGLPRMASRVLARLYLTDSRSLTAAELVRQLRVSPASISKAIGYLEQLELVERRPDPRGRFEHYVIAEDVWFRTWIASARANASWAEVGREGAELFGISTPAGARLEQMARFFAQLSEDMAGGPTAAAADDAMTVFAALVHAGSPLTAEQLATALDWPLGRVAKALADSESYAAFTDPISLDRPTPDTYTLAATPGRLTPAQRRSLETVAELSWGRPARVSP